jgi:hypothetical protein
MRPPLSSAEYPAARTPLMPAEVEASLTLNICRPRSHQDDPPRDLKWGEQPWEFVGDYLFAVQFDDSPDELGNIATYHPDGYEYVRAGVLDGIEVLVQAIICQGDEEDYIGRITIWPARIDVKR